ncbi:sensor histidine kinase [Methylocystis sp. JAN1]|uniref:sensor histidine kinase n=1 Tax=Methylocystis sp. JAN1 TaxID=3397211 RepID=UPI003FA31539
MSWTTQLARLSAQRPAGWRWFLALTIFAACLGGRFLLAPWLAQMKFLTFYPGIATATLICGWAQGLLVLLLSTIAAWYFFFEPINSLDIKEPNTIVSLVGFVLASGFILVIVAALRALVERLEKANRAQEELFRELQHRVANNLQLAVVMLRNARRGVSDAPSVEAIAQAEDRIEAMSRLHRRLHDGTAFADGLQVVIEDVLRENFRELPVDATVDVEAGAELSLDRITALVLLVNEAATNAAKHVFGKGLGARFEVTLAAKEPGRLLLMIRDDGPGIEASAAERSGATLGMDIMRAFAAQLGGTLQVADAPGATLSVEFAPA